MKHYTLENKPNFTYGQIVKLDTAWFGDTKGVIEVKILGKAVTHILDYWIIDLGFIYSKEYPYSATAMGHTAFVDESKD